MPRTLTIDIISDVVCPWCFIGRRRLQAVMQQLHTEQPELAISVQWHPYFLNPDTPPEGEPYRPFLEKKFGGAAALEAIWQRLRDVGNEAGIAFAFERISTRPNTLDAHRLIYRAQSLGLGEAWVEALFAAHFLHGRHIGDRATLAEIASEIGDDPAQVRDFLRGDAGRDEVRALAEQAQRMGVSGVPFLIFDRRLAVTGAQTPEVLLDVMNEALSEAH